MRRARGGLAVLAVVVVTLAGCTVGKETAASPRSFRPGSDGAGDRYFPTYGNGGYDVAGYDLRLRYDPVGGVLTGTATITATATQDLSRFDLDLAHLKTERVTVDGRAATGKATGNELVITPAAGLAKGTAFTVVVTYGGQPLPLNNKTLGVGGWLRRKVCALGLVLSESD
jgi:aminopeptidase N